MKRNSMIEFNEKEHKQSKETKKRALQLVAMLHLMDVVNEDHDIQSQILDLSGLPVTQESIDLLNEALWDMARQFQSFVKKSAAK